MDRDVKKTEETLVRELRGVAGGLDVPPLPELPQPASAPTWQRLRPLLLVAAVVLVAVASVATLVSLLAGLGEDGRIRPAPAPSPTRATDGATESTENTEEPTPLTDAAPSVPYVLGGELWVEGEQVPGAWSLVDGQNGRWLALRADGTWWTGAGTGTSQLPHTGIQPPVLSPAGSYVGQIVRESGGTLTGLETVGGAAPLPGTPVPLRDDDLVGVRVGAVTDDGRLIASGRGVSVLWQPLLPDAEPIDLTRTAPDQLVWQATPAGLVVVDATGNARDPQGGDVYLAELSADGEVTRIGDLPRFGRLEASTDWVAYLPPGVLGGEVTQFGEISVQRVDGSDPGVVEPPAGWSFSTGPFTWESEDLLVATAVRAGEERMVRCSPASQECVLLDTP